LSTYSSFKTNIIAVKKEISAKMSFSFLGLNLEPLITPINPEIATGIAKL